MLEKNPRIFHEISSDNPGSLPEQPGIQSSEVPNVRAAALTAFLQNPSPEMARAMSLIIDSTLGNTHPEQGQVDASTNPLDTSAV